MCDSACDAEVSGGPGTRAGPFSDARGGSVLPLICMLTAFAVRRGGLKAGHRNGAAAAGVQHCNGRARTLTGSASLRYLLLSPSRLRESGHTCGPRPALVRQETTRRPSCFHVCRFSVAIRQTCLCRGRYEMSVIQLQRTRLVATRLIYSSLYSGIVLVEQHDRAGSLKQRALYPLPLEARS